MKRKLMMIMIAVIMTFTDVLTMRTQSTVYVFMRSVGGVK